MDDVMKDVTSFSRAKGLDLDPAKFTEKWAERKAGLIEFLGGHTVEIPANHKPHGEDILRAIRGRWGSTYGLTKEEIEQGYAKDGTKVGRKLRQEVLKLDVREYTFDQWWSNLISEHKCVGTIYLSCHPIELLLISQHTTGWTSCLSFDGCYVQGLPAYPFDPCTLVAYLASKKADCNYLGREHPIKSWRQMVYHNPGENAVALSVHYPDDKMPAENTVLAWFKDRLGELIQHDKEPRFNKDDPGPYIDRTRVFSDGTLPVYEMGGSIDIAYDLGLELGQTCTCCGCGIDEYNSVYHDGHEYCDECFYQQFSDCCICHETYPREELHHHDHDSYCGDCYDDQFTTCPVCKDTIPHDALIETQDGDVCEACYADEFSYCVECSDDYHTSNLIEVNGDWYCEECSKKEGYQECSKCFMESKDCVEVDSEWVCEDCREGDE